MNDTAYENLRGLESLSQNFTPKCVRTLDRGFDANDYYRYFLKRGEHFVIRAKKNRNVTCGGQTCNIMDVSLQSIRNLNLLAMLAVGCIGLTTAIQKDSIFLAELKECSQRIYEMPKYIFYALGYALERVLSMSRCGISGFLPPKVKSQQLTLFEYFKIADCGT